MRQGSQLADSETLFIACIKIGKKFKNICTKAVDEFGLTPNEIEIIQFLTKYKKLDTAKDIVEYLGISKSLVCRSAESLRKRGYLVAQKDEEDHRVTHLFLQSSADEIVRRLNKQTKEFFQETFQDISEEERFALKSIMDKVANNILA